MRADNGTELGCSSRPFRCRGGRPPILRGAARAGGRGDGPVHVFGHAVADACGDEQLLGVHVGAAAVRAERPANVPSSPEGTDAVSMALERKRRSRGGTPSVSDNGGTVALSPSPVWASPEAAAAAAAKSRAWSAAAAAQVVRLEAEITGASAAAVGHAAAAIEDDAKADPAVVEATVATAIQVAASASIAMECAVFLEAAAAHAEEEVTVRSALATAVASAAAEHEAAARRVATAATEVMLATEAVAWLGTGAFEAVLGSVAAETLARSGSIPTLGTDMEAGADAMSAAFVAAAAVEDIVENPVIVWAITRAG